MYNFYQFKIHDIIMVSLLLFTSMVYGQYETETHNPKYRHSLGSSLFMFGNLLEDSPDYGLLTYGYRLNQKERIYIEFNTWKYSEPLGTYTNSEELYPGYVRAFGIGIGYQRFIWKGLHASVSATPFIKQYRNNENLKIQKGFQLYTQLILGYRFELFKERIYIEPALALKFWPIDTNFPDEFAKVEEGAPNYIIEPSLNIGYRF